MKRCYGCLFWSQTDSRKGEVWGWYSSSSEFAELLKNDFKRWGIKNPFVLIAPAWRMRIIKILLRGF